MLQHPSSQVSYLDTCNRIPVRATNCPIILSNSRTNYFLEILQAVSHWLLNCMWYDKQFVSYYGILLLTWSTKHLPGHVGVNELTVGFSGNNLFWNWSYHSTNAHTGIWLQVSRYETWELGCCNMQYFAQVLIYIKHSSHWVCWAYTFHGIGWTILVLNLVSNSLVPRFLRSGTRNWTCSCGESLVFFLTWAPQKVERR